VTIELPTVERVAALHRIDLFASTPGRVLVAVARATDEVTFDAGQTIIREGAVEDHLFAIVEGNVRVERGGRVLVELGAGSTVGELAALVPEPRAASVVALGHTRVLRISKPVLDELLADWPELAASVITALVTRLRAAADHAGSGA
jgi:CRP/FNR family transcriptional regulator, cyclic AMP receptor protein